MAARQRRCRPPRATQEGHRLPATADGVGQGHPDRSTARRHHGALRSRGRDSEDPRRARRLATADAGEVMAPYMVARHRLLRPRTHHRIDQHPRLRRTRGLRFWRTSRAPTRLWEANQTRWRPLVALLDRTVSEAVAAHGGGTARRSRARATVSWPRSPAPATRWPVLCSYSGYCWRRSGCGSGCTPAISNCATKATTPVRQSIGRHGRETSRMADRPYCRARQAKWLSINCRPMPG